MVIVIPCFNEPDIIATLESLANCQHPENPVEVIIVINASTDNNLDIIRQNELTNLEAKHWIKLQESSKIYFRIIFNNELPPKKAGVGLARKIGMDEAARRLPTEGIIVGLDADSTVDINYLTELEKHFNAYPEISGCSIYFEHPLPKSLNTLHRNAIIQYELHLRYFIEIQRNISYPFAYQTIGSSMAVRNKDYQALGGMNTRKAGEDFYFLHKFIKNGRFSELNTTAVFPSPRISDRVPFGTGKAVRDLINSTKGSDEFLTYHPFSFKIIDDFLSHIPDFYNGEFGMVGELDPFLETIKFSNKMNEIRSNTTTVKKFTKRFYQWFDAFLLMKTLHFLRVSYHPDIPILEACKLVIENDFNDPVNLLYEYRIRARHGFYPII